MPRMLLKPMWMSSWSGLSVEPASAATTSRRRRLYAGHVLYAGPGPAGLALKPNGINTIVLKAITDSAGYARASFVSGTGPSSIGTYQLTAAAMNSGLSATAKTTFGTIGVKVWIFKGEIVEDRRGKTYSTGV